MAIVKPWMDFPPPPQGANIPVPVGPAPTAADVTGGSKSPPQQPPPSPPPPPQNIIEPTPNEPPPPPPAPPAPESHAQHSHDTINSNISLEQWQAWEQFYDATCPPATPYRSQKVGGDNVCAETPDNCPPGKTAWGQNECRPVEWVQQHGGGGGSQPSQGGPGFPGGGGIDQSIQSLLQQMLQPGGTRYSPEVMQMLLAGVKQQAAGGAERGIASAKSDAAARGMLQSGRTGARIDAIRRGAESSVLGAQVDITKAKIDADRQDKLDALDRAQKWLDSLRDNMYRTDLSMQQRQQFAANLSLAYAQIQAQFDLLKAQAGYNQLNQGYK